MAGLVGMDPWRYVTAESVEEQIIQDAVLQRAVTFYELSLRTHAALIAGYISQVFSGKRAN
jgi:hypothetical protein